MKVRLIRDTIVRMQKDTLVEVTETEGKRLIAFGNAEAVNAVPKKTSKKKAGK